MDKGVTCVHLNKLVDVLEKEILQSKENISCFDCDCPGPNLWICLQPDCHHIGCSEINNDHSTIHNRYNPSHCVHMNVSTERVWCYGCEKEVHVGAALALNRSYDLGSATRLAAEAEPSARDSDTEDSDTGDDDDDTTPRGLVGLQNMGNTCYMNAALQALSHTPPLAGYFLECAAAVNVLANEKKPGLSKSYQKLIREMWNKKTRGYVVPNGILYGIRNVHPMFRGYQQHDAQEFLRCFMDQLHEELKEPVGAAGAGAGAGAGAADRSPRARTRRRAASSGASEAPALARALRTAHGEARSDGYLRVHTASEPGARRHRRSASYAGTQRSYVAHYCHVNGERATSPTRDPSSESEPSGDELYETCSSGSDADTRSHAALGGGDGARCRSVISDVFDGRLLSSVQCLVCSRVSTRVETFQDLSLPIPTREHLAVLRLQQPPPAPDSWMWWLLGWLRSWFYGPVVSLQDCLAAFFSADELKGDNMYSCSRCNKLRNGVKTSGALALPEVLCVHLKRFRHELMFSCKVGARVAFPLTDLDMAPYTRPDCTSKITRYELCSVICHSGTAGGGHYTCVARHPRGWHQFDDASVAPAAPAAVAASEAYVLFYRFNTWAEPGPIDNHDFACAHGGVRPERAPHAARLARRVPPRYWRRVHAQFGGGPACASLAACVSCAAAARRLCARRDAERAAFCRIHSLCQDQQPDRAVFAISLPWFRRWQAFVRGQAAPPPPVDNTPIVDKQQEADGALSYALRPSSEHAQIGEDVWRFFADTYGGGPEVISRRPRADPAPAPAPVPAANGHCDDTEEEMEVNGYPEPEPGSPRARRERPRRKRRPAK